MSKKECLHENINDKENLSSTSKFYSTKIGWADIDDALIDSSISRALESLKKIKYVPLGNFNLMRFFMTKRIKK